MDPSFDLRSLPRPTYEQYVAFAKHVGEAHSWYKHLPLLTGGQFVVFLAPDSGIGQLAARFDGSVFQLETPPEGPVFTEDRPRLHYSWKTSDEYRRRFGFLDYALRNRDNVFCRDVGGPMELPAEVWERCTFTLFPYVSRFGHDTVTWAHEEAVRELRAGAPHPRREAVLEWARLAHEQEECWESLTKAELELVLALRRGGADKTKATAAVHRYLELGAELDAVYYKLLRPGELAKIWRALRALRGWRDGR